MVPHVPQGITSELEILQSQEVVVASVKRDRVVKVKRVVEVINSEGEVELDMQNSILQQQINEFLLWNRHLQNTIGEDII